MPEALYTESAYRELDEFDNPRNELREFDNPRNELGEFDNPRDLRKKRCFELDEFGNPRSTNSTNVVFLKCRKKCYGTENKEATSSASALRD